jgi:hypothetical protein
VIVFARHTIPCTGQLSVAVDLSLLGAVVVSQLIDFFGLLCCCSLFRSTKYGLCMSSFLALVMLCFMST